MRLISRQCSSDRAGPDGRVEKRDVEKSAAKYASRARTERALFLAEQPNRSETLCHGRADLRLHNGIVLASGAHRRPTTPSIAASLNRRGSSRRAVFPSPE